MKKQAGFTLIELIAVIVILGILAATALPRFVDLSDAAEDAAVKGVAGNLSSATALNYAAHVASTAGISGTPAVIGVATCTDAAATLMDGALPTGYSTVAGTAVAAGQSGPCVLTHTGGKTANFTIYGATAAAAIP